MASLERLPEFAAHAIEGAYGVQEAERIAQGMEERRATSLRANALLASREEVASALEQAGLSWESVPWYRDAFLLKGARADQLWGLPAYTEGKLYLQSLSSMIPPLLVDPAPGDEILDMCAAPGGKTTQMAAMGGRGCYITAVEMNAPRAEKLAFNLQRQGAGGVNVLRQDARRLDSFLQYSKVLLDAPCSGSGTLWLGDPKLAKRFNAGLLAKVRKQQAALLDKALQLVKPGGLLVYSTCSVLKEENEEQVRAALKRARRTSFRIEPIALGEAQGIPTLPSTLEGALTLCPSPLYEGFFACKLRRES
ncbi:MAG: RsmB/NOP family class I SAM-dependent RNA methyltransferase [Coriobacteriales bacterium]